MKKPKHLNKLIIIIGAIVLQFTFANKQLVAQNVGINATGSVPNSSALLDVDASPSNNKGLLIPRIALTSSTDIVTITSPATSLVVYNTNAVMAGGSGTGFYYYNGSKWIYMIAPTDSPGTSGQVLTSQGTGNPPQWSLGGGGSGWLLTGNASTLAGTNFIGTTDNQALDIRTNNILRTRITAKGQIETLSTGQSVFVGESAGAADDLTLNKNVFIGYQAGFSNTSGYFNTANGYQALANNIIGVKNTACGYGALYSTTGSRSTANGYLALYSNTTGDNNTASGNMTLMSNTTGSYNTATGSSALHNNITGNNNAAYGNMTLSNNSTGSNNTAIGYRALYGNSTGWSNTAIGYQALFGNLGGSENTATGIWALYSNTTGGDNTANGIYALYSNTTGNLNTATGDMALTLNTIGYGNVATGAGALYNNTTGNLNVAIGKDVLYGNTTGSENTAIGFNAFSTGIAYSNSTALGYNVAITASNQVRIGSNAVTSIGGFANWTNVSDVRFKKNIQENVPGLDFIKKLRPVTYNLDMDKITSFLNTPDSLRLKEAETLKSKVQQTGFIAQEVEEAARATGFEFSGIDKPKNKNDYYGLRYAAFVVPLVKAVQELADSNEKLEKRANRQQETIDKLKKKINEIEPNK